MKTRMVSAPKDRKPQGFWRALLNNFEKAGSEALEVIPEPAEYKSTHSLQATISGAIYRYGFDMHTRTVGGHVFIIKGSRRDSV